jgi:phosphotransferase system  glucose/maltose/N-acetylglucosamine-specific IIC component
VFIKKDGEKGNMTNKEKAIAIIIVIVSIVNIAYSLFWLWLIFTHNQEMILMNLVFGFLYPPLLCVGLKGLILKKYWKI